MMKLSIEPVATAPGFDTEQHRIYAVLRAHETDATIGTHYKLSESAGKWVVLTVSS